MASEDDIVQRIVLDGDKATIQQFNAIGDAGVSAFKRISDAAGQIGSGAGLGSLDRIFTGLGTNFANIKNAAAAVGKSFGELEAAALSSGKRIGEIGLAIGGAIVGLALFSKSQAEAGASIIRTAEAIGTTTKKYQEMAFAAGQAGISSEGFASSQSRLARALDATQKTQLEERNAFVALNRELALGRISFDDYNKSLQDLQFKATQVIDPFKRLGVQIAKNKDGSIDVVETELRLADAFQKSNDSVTKQAAVLQLYGRGQSRMVSLLNQGREGFAAQAKEAERLGLVISESVLQRQERLEEAFNKLGKAADAAKQNFSAAFAPTISHLIDGIVEALAHYRADLVQLGTFLASKLSPIVDDFLKLISGRSAEIAKDSPVLAFANAAKLAGTAIAQAYTIIKNAVSGIMTVLNILADAFNHLFGTNITGATLAVILIFGKLTGTLGLVSSAIGTVASIVRGLIAIFGGWELILIVIIAYIGFKLVQALMNVDWKAWAQFATDAWNTIKQDASAVIDWLTSAWGAVLQFFKNIWDKIADIANQAWITASNAAQIGIDYVKGLFTDLLNFASTTWDGIKNKIMAVWNSVKSYIGSMVSASSAAPPTPSPAQGFAGGGLLRGPGTGTSDSIPIWGSAGEFMMRTRAVAKYGLGIMQSINNLQFNPLNVAHLVPAPVAPKTHFASGGLVHGGGTLNLSIDGNSFNGLRAGKDTMEKLTRYAIDRQVRSAGRRQTWRRD